MNKIITAGLAALTLGGFVAMTTVPADAAPHGGYGGHGGSYHAGGYGGGYRGGGGGYWRGGRWYGYGVGAGLAGFALGAAIADDGYYGPYYGGYYDAGPYSCVAHRRVWDPYVGGWVMRPYYYAC
jgi:hypothetical protein